MQLEQFAMERMQSTYENRVEFNLAESGVHPLHLHELVSDPGQRDELLGQLLGYTQSNGTPELRELVSSLYPGASPEHVEITNGGSEANYLVAWRQIEPGDEVVLMTPNYMQIWGLARGFGATVREWPLRVDNDRGRGWAADLDELRSLVNRRTKLIAICNPNNPTGARLTEPEVDAICKLAAMWGCWLLSDEIYRGAEIDGRETPSAWGRHERVVITSGLSKAYGLPGLRIGWIVAPPAEIEACWARHDYTTIAPSALSDRLARFALAPDRRRRLLERTRSILRANWPVLEGWLRERADQFSVASPEAGAIAYVQYHQRINSTDLVTRLRIEKSVLIVPGDHFGMDGYLRIGFGTPEPYLRAGLGRLHELLASLPEAVGA